MSNQSCIDEAAIAQIREIGGNELLVKLIDLFVEYVGGRLVAARCAVQQDNIDAVRDAVHPIKSSAANLGARHVREIAQQIEQLAKLNNARHIPARLDDLDGAFALARDALLKLRGEISA